MDIQSTLCSQLLPIKVVDGQSISSISHCPVSAQERVAADCMAGTCPCLSKNNTSSSSSSSSSSNSYSSQPQQNQTKSKFLNQDQSADFVGGLSESSMYTKSRIQPQTYDQVRSDKSFQKRSKARLCGMSGNFWYPVEQSSKVPRNTAKAAIWWKTHLCLWRGADNTIRCIEDRCAHRQLRLSVGNVDGNCITCCYHGWSYDESGKVIKVAHEVPKSFKSFPRIQVRSFPVKEKYGLIWVFPGDPSLADKVQINSIPWLDQEHPLPYKLVDVVFKAHFSLIVENNCDFYHAYLHRKFKPFDWPKFKFVERKGDQIQVNYKTNMSNSVLASYFNKSPLENMNLFYDYPCQRSNLENKFLHWCFFLPIDENTTRTFFIFLWGPISVAGIPLPYSIRPPLMNLTHKFYLTPLLTQDLNALEEEQKMHSVNWDKNAIELNPIISAFQQMTVEKWEEYLQSEAARKKAIGVRRWRREHGGGLSDYSWAVYK